MNTRQQKKNACTKHGKRLQRGFRKKWKNIIWSYRRKQKSALTPPQLRFIQEELVEKHEQIFTS